MKSKLKAHGELRLALRWWLGRYKLAALVLKTSLCKKQEGRDTLSHRHFMENPSAKDVRDYLNHLTELKKGIKWPISLEIEDDLLYHVFDGDGKIVATMTKEVYQVFQEL